MKWLRRNEYYYYYPLVLCADLPRDVLSTPMGQMLAPMIQQMTPSGTAIPFMGEPVAASDHMSSKFFFYRYQSG
jgi:hypothetical protein